MIVVVPPLVQPSLGQIALIVGVAVKDHFRLTRLTTQQGYEFIWGVGVRTSFDGVKSSRSASMFGVVMNEHVVGCGQ